MRRSRAASPSSPGEYCEYGEFRSSGWPRPRLHTVVVGGGVGLLLLIILFSGSEGGGHRGEASASAGAGGRHEAGDEGGGGGGGGGGGEHGDGDDGEMDFLSSKEFLSMSTTDRIQVSTGPQTNTLKLPASPKSQRDVLPTLSGGDIFSKACRDILTWRLPPNATSPDSRDLTSPSAAAGTAR